MGHALIVLAVPEEQLALAGLRRLNPETGGVEPLPRDAQWKPQAFERAVQEHPDAFWTLQVHPSDVWWLPEEPREQHGRRWHFDPKLLAAHVEKVRGSLESFLNAKLEQLDDMVRSGWFIIQRARVRVTEMREQPHHPSEFELPKRVQRPR